MQDVSLQHTCMALSLQRHGAGVHACSTRTMSLTLSHAHAYTCVCAHAHTLSADRHEHGRVCGVVWKSHTRATCPPLLSHHLQAINKQAGRRYAYLAHPDLNIM